MECDKPHVIINQPSFTNAVFIFLLGKTHLNDKILMKQHHQQGEPIQLHSPRCAKARPPWVAG